MNLLHVLLVFQAVTIMGLLALVALVHSLRRQPKPEAGIDKPSEVVPKPFEGQSKDPKYRNLMRRTPIYHTDAQLYDKERARR